MRKLEELSRCDSVNADSILYGTPSYARKELRRAPGLPQSLKALFFATDSIEGAERPELWPAKRETEGH